MANPYPANFETLEGGGRLTGQVNFTDSGNQPGGTYTPPTAREQVSGNVVSIANAAAVALTWDFTSGTALLDRADTSVPTIITAGIYSLTVLAQAAEALTAGGFFEIDLDMNLSGDDGSLSNISSPVQNAVGRSVSVIAAVTWYMPAGGDIRTRVRNLDGAATRNFLLANAVLQRIT